MTAYQIFLVSCLCFDFGDNGLIGLLGNAISGIIVVLSTIPAVVYVSEEGMVLGRQNL